MKTQESCKMSLADELKQRIDQVNANRVFDLVVANQDAILAALRGRDAVLEEAAKVCDGPNCALDRMEAARRIRAMKEGKHAI